MPRSRFIPPVREIDPAKMVKCAGPWAWAVKTSPREKAVLMAVAYHPDEGTDDLAKLTDMSIKAVEEALKELMLQGHVCKTPHDTYVTTQHV